MCGRHLLYCYTFPSLKNHSRLKEGMKILKLILMKTFFFFKQGVIVVLEKILHMFKLRQFGPLCFVYMILTSSMDIFPSVNYTTMIHTPENPVICYKWRSKWKKEQGASVETQLQDSAGREWSLWSSSHAVLVFKCVVLKASLILMFY